jgi:hypothetical protein
MAKLKNNIKELNDKNETVNISYAQTLNKSSNTISSNKVSPYVSGTAIGVLT